MQVSSLDTQLVAFAAKARQLTDGIMSGAECNAPLLASSAKECVTKILYSSTP